MNRRQIFKMIFLLPILGLVGERRLSVPFLDVSPSTLWGKAIHRLRGKGYVAGIGDNCFDPHAEMTRGQIAVLILRTRFGLDYKPFKTGFLAWYENAVNRGLMLASDPEQPATRADLMVLMDGLL